MNKIVYRLFKIRHTSMVGDIFDEHCCLLGKEVLDNVFARDFLKMKEIPFTYKGKRYKRQYEWVFRGDVAKIIIGVKREYGIVGAMVYINYSKLRYEPYVAIVDRSDVFGSIDVVADMVEGALNWVYKDSGITLCLEPWIPAEGEVIQWGRDCNEAHNLAAIHGTIRTEENWDLKTCVKRIIKKHTKKRGASPPQKKSTNKSERTLRSAIIDQTKADLILQKIAKITTRCNPICNSNKAAYNTRLIPFAQIICARTRKAPLQIIDKLMPQRGPVFATINITIFRNRTKIRFKAVMHSLNGC